MSKEKNLNYPLNNIVDMHSHILPEMDDGAKSVEISLEMLSAEYNQGIRNVLLTPHFYPTEEDPEKFLARREMSAQKLVNNIGNASVPNLFLGAEVAFYSGISHSKDIKKLCIMGTDFVMIEMPFCKWTDKEIEEIVSMRSALGVRPIIAHIERYIDFQKNNVFSYLLENGILIQTNAEAFLEKKSCKTVTKLIKKGCIHCLGSDSHNLTSRKPNIQEAIPIIIDELGTDYLDFVCGVSMDLLHKATAIN